MPRFNLDPVAKPRMTQSDRWRDRPAVARYWAFKDEIQRQVAQMGFKLGNDITIIFLMPMPQSWNKAKKQAMLHQPHQQKPDLDNLEKALLDSLLPDNDSVVWRKMSQKRWAYEGCIIVDNNDRSD